MGQQDVDLEPAAFREVPTKPLARPAELWRGVAIFGAGTVLCAFGASALGGFWAAFLPTIPAIWVGIGIAGLYPGMFFRSPTE